jgi:hypothetical protein
MSVPTIPSYDDPMESRIKAAAADAVRTGGLYWEALAADLDDRLVPLLSDSAIVRTGRSTALSHCQTLRLHHRVSPAECLLMAPRLPGRILADASFGLRYGQDLPLAQPARPEGEAEPLWTLRLVMVGNGWRVDPYTPEQDWTEIGFFTMERHEPEHPN